MTVLILASEQDPSADVMVHRLRDLAVPVLRLDTAWFPQHVSVDASLKAGRWTGRIAAFHRQVELEEIRSVWYRSPRAFRLPDELTDVEAAHAFVEAKYGFGGVLATLPADGIRLVMYRLELVYGALDFVVTPAGEWVFLEVNPSGQFGWLDAAADIDVAGKLAHLLAAGRRP